MNLPAIFGTQEATDPNESRYKSLNPNDPNPAAPPEIKKIINELLFWFLNFEVLTDYKRFLVIEEVK
jgi:hypothetical protein